ncbi:hypothetical protein F0562_030340 [Nyssa sinensis]|uniref:Uncharacterized protein n=1 Tax=Nyssa sinensis TaxID=561372 RepID=A0A5J5B0Q1_9ASTE|nr:hypothetical protein F0562_030340 [Nyssa sinensis]
MGLEGKEKSFWKNMAICMHQIWQDFIASTKKKIVYIYGNYCLVLRALRSLFCRNLITQYYNEKYDGANILCFWFVQDFCPFTVVSSIQSARADDDDDINTVCPTQCNASINEDRVNVTMNREEDADDIVVIVENASSSDATFNTIAGEEGSLEYIGIAHVEAEDNGVYGWDFNVPVGNSVRMEGSNALVGSNTRYRGFTCANIGICDTNKACSDSDRVEEFVPNTSSSFNIIVSPLDCGSCIGLVNLFSSKNN